MPSYPYSELPLRYRTVPYRTVPYVELTGCGGGGTKNGPRDLILNKQSIVVQNFQNGSYSGLEDKSPIGGGTTD